MILNDYDFKASWISVDTYLPKRFERVLVICVNNRQNQMQRHIAIREYCGIDQMTKCHMWSGNSKVTHWMPLPEIPELPIGKIDSCKNDIFKACFRHSD